MRHRITARRDRRAFDTAIGTLKVLEASLKTTVGPLDRVRLYEDMTVTYQVLGRTVDPAIMPPLAPGDGSSYEQGYADMAGLTALLAFAEQRFAVLTQASRRPAGNLPGFYGTCPIAERGRWDIYLSTTRRSARASILFDLYEITAARIGCEAASVINMAAWTEQASARP